VAEPNGEHDGAHRDLFSMVASDNAEVVRPDAPRGKDSMWSVAANAEGDLNGSSWEEWQDAPAASQSATAHNGASHSSAPHDDTSQHAASQNATWSTSQPPRERSAPPPFSGWSSAPGPDDAQHADEDHGGAWSGSAEQTAPRSGVDALGSIFSALPVDHPDDVVDEADIVGESAWTVSSPTEGSLFSNGSHLRAEPGHVVPPQDQAADPARQTAWNDPWVERDAGWEPSGAEWDPQLDEVWDDHPDAILHEVSGPAGPGVPPLEDPQGFDTAILRLHPQDRERAHVPLSVCGALLHEHEHVRGVVTGQMLGRPAAVVVTDERVLVVNDRRWQPVVDIFPIDGELVVRGRHDRHVAALSFADHSRVSMVDGIGEVDIAIELAEHIRNSGAPPTA